MFHIILLLTLASEIVAILRTSPLSSCICYRKRCLFGTGVRLNDVTLRCCEVSCALLTTDGATRHCCSFAIASNPLGVRLKRKRWASCSWSKISNSNKLWKTRDYSKNDGSENVSTGTQHWSIVVPHIVILTRDQTGKSSTKARDARKVTAGSRTERAFRKEGAIFDARATCALWTRWLKW